MLTVSIDSFSYSNDPILKDVSFSLDKGSHLAILGESGCGKSTLLHLVYGLLHLENGSILWEGQELKGPKFNLVPGEPFIKLVAQEFNVMPFTTVSENVATFLSRIDADEDQARVNELLSVVGLAAFEDVKVKDLSGGQKQRVALAKALANEPELLLLDEPFSHIDTFRKNSLRRKLFSYLKEKNISCITATHDAEEALAYSDEMIILNNNTIEAKGTPEALYNNISTEHQGSFFGEVNVVSDSFLLPHQLKISKEPTDIQVVVIRSYFKGSHYLIEAEWEAQKVYFVSSKKHKENSILYLISIND